MCVVCQRVPQDPALCLLCGLMVCLGGDCCKSRRGEVMLKEGVRHSIDCGGGTAPFIAVASSFVKVIHGNRVVYWGSVYVDAHEEEDIGLR